MQQFTMTPKQNPETLPPITITNAYCRPALDHDETAEFCRKLRLKHKEDNNIRIIMRDLNAKTTQIGDKENSVQGKHMIQNMTKHQCENLSRKYAYGTPTFETIKGGWSIVDPALVPTNQLHLWTSLKVANTHKISQSTHHSIIAESKMPIYHKSPPIETKYTINYNIHDSHRLQTFIERIIDPIHEEFTDIQGKYLNKQTNAKIIEQAMIIFQDIQFAMHHITALLIFGTRRTYKSSNNIFSWENMEEIQSITNNMDISNTQKTTQLRQLIQEHNIKRKRKKRDKQLSESTLKMFKKYSHHKREHKTTCNETIKIAIGDILPIEEGYSHYLGKTLMKPINDDIPSKEEDDYIVPDEEKLTAHSVTITSIAKVIHKLNKGKAPGTSAIPITYYEWGATPMHHLLDRWYCQMEEYQCIPLNLKLDVKILFPKYETDAKSTTKQDPAKYRLITLQNSMYKMLDGCMKRALECHDSNHKMINDSQGGFKQKEGTIEHLYIIHNIFQYNKHVYCAFLDLQKAYDSVWIEALIAKLHTKYKVPPDTINWIKAMYQNTKSCTRVGNRLSGTFQTHNGLQ